MWDRLVDAERGFASSQYWYHYDNIDSAVRKYGNMVYPNKTINAGSLKAFLVTSYGFGQKGGQVIGVHPRYVFATLEREPYEEYCEGNIARQNEPCSLKQHHLRSQEPATLRPSLAVRDCDWVPRLSVACECLQTMWRLHRHHAMICQH